jgi:hypothetical protein
MIKQMLLFSRVYGCHEALDWLHQIVVERQPDALLFAGGILPKQRQAGGFLDSANLTPQEAEFVKSFFTLLGGLTVISLIIPGPAGEPLEEFLRLGLWAEALHPNLHIAHATLVETDGLAASGLGGIIAEKELLGVDTYSRPTAEYFLRSLSSSNKPRKVLLLPNPPLGLLGGAEGEPLIGDLIDTYHPDLCVVAGSSERRGCQHVGRTLVVNPGSLADGSAAWLDWRMRGVDSVKFLDRELPVSPRKVPSTDEIRRCAYLRWLAAGQPRNSALRFWLDAESELLPCQ